MTGDPATHSAASTVFWSGAGLSVDNPTGGPIGRKLTDRALDEYLLPSARGDLAALYAGLEVPDAKFRPRLETVLDAVTDVYGYGALTDVLSDLADCRPNRHHHFMARHLAAGGRHITANFDTCIERALTTAVAHPPIHFHEALAPDSDILRLGARLRTIQSGFPPAVRRQLDDTLTAPGAEALVFVGYSGSDFFDATPYLLEQWDTVRRLRILWLEFRKDEQLTLLTPPYTVEGNLLPLLLRRFDQEPGAGLEIYSGPLDDFLRAVSSRWNLPDDGASPRDAAPTPWHSAMERPDADRRAATIALFGRMGYRAGVLQVLAGSGPHDAREWDWLADAYWGDGQYRRAEKAWHNAFPGDDEVSKAKRVERTGAVLWILGDLRAAERLLWDAIERWCNPAGPVSPLVACEILETYGRVIEHMRRLPDARWLVRRGRVTRAEQILRQLFDPLDERIPLDLRTRLSNVLRAYTGERDHRLDHAVDTFEQSEALHSWLNYEHARLRLRLSDGTDPALIKDDLDRMGDREVRLGSREGAARLHLLPGVMKVRTPVSAWRTFAAIDMTRWHRMRLMAGVTAVFLAQRGRSLAARSARMLANLRLRTRP